MAKISSTSLPMIQRAMSRSWMVMSRNMPPETLTYSAGGGSGSLLVMRTRWGAPISPPATISLARLNPGSKRRLKPIISLTPASSTLASAWSMRARSRWIGFSQKMCLPASAACSICRAWRSVEEQMATASISGSSRIRRGSSQALPARQRRAHASAAARSTSATARSSAPGTRKARFSAWILPMRPAPITPTLMRSDIVTSSAARARSSGRASLPGRPLPRAYGRGTWRRRRPLPAARPWRCTAS